LFDFVLPNTLVRAASVAGTFTTRGGVKRPLQ
jgi:hypothetical protein